MNEIFEVNDCDIQSIQASEYDLAIFASGHETRARFASSVLSPDRARRTVVFGFESFRADGSRVENDCHFLERWGQEPKIIGTRADQSVYETLEELIGDRPATRILIDYSSMSRFWYAAVLNWLRFRWKRGSIEIDLLYAPSRYNAPIPRLEVDQILSIPGCEGNTASSGPSVALIGLGFDGLSALCVLDDLEPDIVKSFLAGGGAEAGYLEQAKEENRELISHYSCEPLVFPIASVQATVRLLSEVIAPFTPGFSISITPLGPKPHVLASILLAMKFPHVACIHVAGRRQSVWDAVPDGRLIGTRVAFRSRG